MYTNALSIVPVFLLLKNTIYICCRVVFFFFLANGLEAVPIIIHIRVKLALPPVQAKWLCLLINVLPINDPFEVTGSLPFIPCASIFLYFSPD